MAYFLTKDGKGPYPNLAGEFCGNHRVGSPAPRDFTFGVKQEQAEAQQEAYLSRMRFGKPAACKAGSSVAMEAEGYVGLYLKEDRPLFSWETAVITDELTEDVVTRGKPI